MIPASASTDKAVAIFVPAPRVSGKGPSGSGTEIRVHVQGRAEPRRGASRGFFFPGPRPAFRAQQSADRMAQPGLFLGGGLASRMGRAYCCFFYPPITKQSNELQMSVIGLRR